MTFGIVAHLVFGGNGLIAGFAGFFSKKGATNHVLAGRIYTVSMVLMAVTGFYYAYTRSVFVTMLAACLTFYLVFTSWLTVQKTLNAPFLTRFLPLIIGLPVATFGLILSWQAASGATDSIGKFTVPAFIYYVFTAVVSLAVLFDLRLALGASQSAAQRIRRHIWRMAFPLYVACSSFFQGQQKVFPQILHGSPVLAIPENLVLLLMLYWLLKPYLVRLKMRFRGAGNLQRP